MKASSIPKFKSLRQRLIQLTRRSISKRILATILIISSILTTFITLFQLGFDYVQDVGVIENSLDLIGESYTKSLSNSLWEFHRKQLQTDIDGILTIPGIRYVHVSSPQSQIQIERGVKPTERALSRVYPLRYQLSPDRNVSLGELTVTADLNVVLQRIYNKVLVIFITQLFKTLIISFAIYFAIQSILTRHLIDITTYLKRLDLKTDNRRLSLKRKLLEDSEAEGKDELDTLVESINQMQDNLKTSYEQLHQLNLQLEDRVAENTRLILDQRQKLEYASKMKSLGEMAGGVAHEINSPLTTISLASDMLLDLGDSPEVDRQMLKKTTRTIQDTAFRISKIIQGLRSFSRDGSRDPMQKTAVKEIVQETLLLCREKLKHSSIELRGAQIPDDLLISCRKVEISQVLVNLLNNAAEAASECQEIENKWIRLDCQATETEVILTVTDCGPGIPPHVRKNIFQPFFTTKDVGKGTGLGLSISLGIIENHGGTLKLDENSPQTSFVITLPRASQEALTGFRKERPLKDLTFSENNPIL